MPLFIPAFVVFDPGSKGLNPTMSAEMTSPVSVEKIGTAVTSFTVSNAGSSAQM